MIVRVLNKDEINLMRAAGKAAAELLEYLGTLVKPGVTTQALNDAAESWTTQHGYRSAPLGYAPFGLPPFPGSICTSKNDVVCHGKPSPNEILVEGDIINVDVTPIVEGWHGDTSYTFKVGEVSKEADRLLRTTLECLHLGIDEVKPGAHLGNIGAAIQEHAEEKGYGVVREFVGHGIHQVFHAEPEVRHYGVRDDGVKLEEGMVFTIEPMLNLGACDVVMVDEWIAVTKDGSLSAQFEHTVLVTENGVEILTKT